MARLFDPQDLLNQDLGVGNIRRDPLPPGECIAQVMETNFAVGTVQKQGPNYGKDWHRLDIKLAIDDPEYLASIPGNTGQPVYTNLGIMLDITDSGGIAMGPNKNIRLNRFREACGVNGQPLSALVGQRCRISIGHKPHPNEPETVLDEIVGYTKV